MNTILAVILAVTFQVGYHHTGNEFDHAGNHKPEVAIMDVKVNADYTYKKFTVYGSIASYFGDRLPGQGGHEPTWGLDPIVADVEYGIKYKVWDCFSIGIEHGRVLDLGLYSGDRYLWTRGYAECMKEFK